MTHNYLYATATFNQFGKFSDHRLSELSERHKISLKIPPLNNTPDLCEELRKCRADGMVIEMLYGWPSRIHLRAARQILASGRKVWFYWPAENAIECIDAIRLKSHWRLWWLVHAIYVSGMKNRLRPYYHFARSIYRRARAIRRSQITVHASPPLPETSLADVAAATRVEVERIIAKARPARFPFLDDIPSRAHRLNGTGVYLRTDFWARIDSGGSYGHTCYVAKALAELTEKLVCFLPHRYALLDDLAVHQVVLRPRGLDGSELNLLFANSYFYEHLKVAFQAIRPTYIYERLCLGNYVGARLSLELGIPYIVEYNGSEISMSRSFANTRFVHEELYLKAEKAAFRQATLISVVSEPIKEDLVKRGIDPAKILVNPNGVDPDAYSPPLPAEKARLRDELGLGGQDRVVGFIGTFGGWHGIDVLAAAIPEVCLQAPEARFLLIGDGSYKHLVDGEVRKHTLQERVLSMGRVPQKEGARLMGACDIYVSPHNAHMVDSRFFGSPTKMFEYMAMAGGIVASDLEQIGQVLSPALRVADLTNGHRITTQRAVLCTPGDKREFVDAVTALVRRPDLCLALGRNARQAAAEHYSWDKHVANLWLFAQGQLNQEQVVPDLINETARPAPDPIRRIETGDEYKDEVQNQWDNNPCGSHYVKEALPHTLEWFLEAEAYRYREYAPWMPEAMEFSKHAGERVLELGGGMGTDLCQFAKHGASVTDVDLSSGHLELARENFRLRGLKGEFIHHDAEQLPFGDDSFDVVYSNGVIHHSPNTGRIVEEMYRVLKPGGRAIIMVYAENSLHYWGQLVFKEGIVCDKLFRNSIGHIMSCSVELTENDARPLVKVYTKPMLRKLFSRFEGVEIAQRQITRPELPVLLFWMPLDLAGQLMGWNLIVKATKPLNSACALQ